MAVPLGPILTAHLLEKVDAHLLSLLDSISLAEWDMPTIVPGWKVRHVAGHLLDTCLRKLSILRDGFAAERPTGSLPEFIHRLNAEGVTVFGRLSPAVVRSLLAVTCEQSSLFHRSLDPYASAAFAVSWAGESESLNWFDTARELTERWHHQQQIRLALGREGILTPELYHPVLDCFLRVLPFHYRSMHAEAGTHLLIEIQGECGGEWHFVRAEERWILTGEAQGDVHAAIRIPEAIAWRIFTTGIPSAETMVRIEGERELVLPVLSAVAIIR